MYLPSKRTQDHIFGTYMVPILAHERRGRLAVPIDGNLVFLGPRILFQPLAMDFIGLASEGDPTSCVMDDLIGYIPEKTEKLKFSIPYYLAWDLEENVAGEGPAQFESLVPKEMCRELHSLRPQHRAANVVERMVEDLYFSISLLSQQVAWFFGHQVTTGCSEFMFSRGVILCLAAKCFELAKGTQEYAEFLNGRIVLLVSEDDLLLKKGDYVPPEESRAIVGALVEGAKARRGA